MEKLHACPFCNSNEGRRPYLSATDHLLSGKLFHVEQCVTCGGLFTNPRPNELNISEYYLSEDYISHAKSARSFTERIYMGVRSYMMSLKIRFIAEYLSEKAQILDMGCGAGDFVLALRKKGFQAIGYEPNPKARQIAEIKGIEVLPGEQALLNMPGQKMDAITLWHVLEHLHEPITMLEQCKRLLKPGGMLVVATPMYNSYDAACYKNEWAAWDLPRHLLHFNRDSLIKLIEKQGFVAIKRRGLPFDSFYISLLSEKNRNNLHPVARPLRAALIGLWSNLLAIGGKKEWSSEMIAFKSVN
jgi:2-polyprenyl-3-methyl-5-hydroxy-6-metoxy-1,4-benzoquinol methylase